MSSSSQKNAPGQSLVIGLTGGIASGKSTVSRLLADRGAYIIDADRVGHLVIEPAGEAFHEVVAAFGEDILDTNGTISRKKLGAIVFTDPKARGALNKISHPQMAARMEREIALLRRSPPEERPPRIVLDAAILFEAGWDALCDRVWTVETAPETATARLMERDAMSKREAEARLAAQMSNEERARRASLVIPNRATLSLLEKEVQRIWLAELGEER